MVLQKLKFYFFFYLFFFNINLLFELIVKYFNNRFFIIRHSAVIVFQFWYIELIQSLFLNNWLCADFLKFFYTVSLMARSMRNVTRVVLSF